MRWPLTISGLTVIESSRQAYGDESRRVGIQGVPMRKDEVKYYFRMGALMNGRDDHDCILVGQVEFSLQL